VAGPLQAALENVADEEARASMPGVTDNIDDDALLRKRLFQGLTFFLSREVPRGYLELVCLAYGGKVGWEGDDSPISMTDPSITHHIVDRPRLPASFETLPRSREFIQPQWILDCANFLFLLPISRYASGAQLPPHLSPWVDNEEEGYKPKYAEEIERLKNGETIDFEEIETTTVDDKEAASDKEVIEEIDGPTDEDEEEEESEEEDIEEDKEDDDALLNEKRERKRKKAEEEEHKLAKTMMSRKAAHLYGRMQHGIAKKQAKVEALHQRRKEIDVQEQEKLTLKGKEKGDDGKSMLKQKVERLKNERKVVEATYSNTGGTMKKAKKRRRN
jgi:pescadillo protein